jgi:hypothetical protein
VVQFRSSLPSGLGGLGIGRNPVPVTLVYRGGFSTSLNVSYTTVIGVNPALSTEYSSLGSLFDEIKVESVSFVYNHIPILGTNPAPTTTNVGVLAYDPGNNGVLTAVGGGAIHQQHKLINLHYGIGIEQGVSVSVNGYSANWFKWDVKIPPGPHLTGTGTLAGMWDSTADTTSNWGWIKPYIEAGGTGIGYTLQYLLYFHCKVRSRS